MLKTNGVLNTEDREEEIKQIEVYKSHSKFMKNKVCAAKKTRLIKILIFEGDWWLYCVNKRSEEEYLVLKKTFLVNKVDFFSPISNSLGERSFHVISQVQRQPLLEPCQASVKNVPYFEDIPWGKPY